MMGKMLYSVVDGGPDDGRSQFSTTSKIVEMPLHKNSTIPESDIKK